MVLSVDPSAEGQLGLGVVLPPDPDGIAALDQPPARRNQRHGLHLPEVELLAQDQHLFHPLHVARRLVAFLDQLDKR